MSRSGESKRKTTNAGHMIVGTPQMSDSEVEFDPP